VANAAKPVHYQGTNAEAAAAFLLFFTTEMTNHIEAWLHEEQGGAHLPSFFDAGGYGHCVLLDLKTILGDQGGEIDLATRVEIFIQGTVESEQAATAEKAPVVAAAGKHGGIANRQVLPAGVVGGFPEDGIKHFQWAGGRAAATPTPPPALPSQRYGIPFGDKLLRDPQFLTPTLPPAPPPILRIWRGGPFDFPLQGQAARRCLRHRCRLGRPFD